MNWYVQHCKNNSCIITWVHINFTRWKSDFFKSLFQFRLHLNHQMVIEIRHLFCIIYSWWWSSFMQVLNCIDPSWYFFRFLISIFNCINIYWGSSNNILTLHILQLQNCFVFTIQCWFIKLCYTKIFLSSIWFAHFKSSIYFSNCRNIVRYKWFQLCF